MVGKSLVSLQQERIFDFSFNKVQSLSSLSHNTVLAYVTGLVKGTLNICGSSRGICPWIWPLKTALRQTCSKGTRLTNRKLKAMERRIEVPRLLATIKPQICVPNPEKFIHHHTSWIQQLLLAFYKYQLVSAQYEITILVRKEEV